MNNIKKVILATPEVAVRRSSIGAQTGLLFDSPAYNKLKQISVNDKVSNELPNILVTTCTPPNDSAKNRDSVVSLDGSINADGLSSIFRVTGRRASCVPSFQAWRSPPDERISRSIFEQNASPWLSESVRRFSQIVSPVAGVGRRRKSISENSEEIDFSGSFNMSPVFSSPSPKCPREFRSQSVIKFPNLSPCIEDKTKNNAFQFDDKSIRIQDNLCTTERKSSVPLNNRVSSQTTKGSYGGATFDYRRNSIAISRLAALHHLNKIDKNTANKESIYMQTLKKPIGLGTFIGKGGFGCVRVGLCKGKKVAIKQLKRLSSLENEMFALNFDVHARLVTTYAIVSCHDSIVASTKARRTSMAETLMSFDPCYFQQAGFSPCTNQKKTFILSELCSTSTLATLINSLDGPLSDRDKIKLLGQLAESIDYLSSCGYAHLDVKPPNCFLTNSGNLKLGDFGCCTPIGMSYNTILGTAAYQCPEILKGESATNTSDVYSWGITALTLLTTHLPYEGLHPHVIIYKVTRLRHRPKCSLKNKTLMESLLIKIIQRCWDQDPTCRPTPTVLRRILSALYLQC